MPENWFPIVDQQGQQAHVASCADDASELEVKLSSGASLLVARNLVSNERDNTCRYRGSFASAAGATAAVLPVVEEQLVVDKQVVQRENVRLKTEVSARDEVVDVALAKEDLHVERVPIGRVVDAVAPPRQEGDVYIMPVYEEVLVTEKRLLLKEEVRVTRVRSEHRHHEVVSLRKEELIVERTNPAFDNTKHVGGGRYATR